MSSIVIILAVYCPGIHGTVHEHTAIAVVDLFFFVTVVTVTGCYCLVCDGVVAVACSSLAICVLFFG